MTDSSPTEAREFILRRVTMTIRDWPWRRDDWYSIEDRSRFFAWAAVLGVILVIGIVYVIWMYVRDGHSIGKFWGGFLALCRLTVYAILSFVFLLPAYQKREDTKQQSKVVALFDVSESMGRRDAPPTEGVDPNLRLTRTDEILKMLGDPSSPAGFFGRLEKNNPVSVYRFGGQLDDNYWMVNQESRVWDKKGWEDSKRSEGEPFSNEYLTRLLKPNKDAPELTDDQKLTLKRLVESANLGGSMQVLLSKERNNMPQGIVLFSDCRSNSGSAATALASVADEARRAKIPVFVVIVGEDRPDVKMDIAGLRAPDWVRPEDPFEVFVDVEGHGLGGHTTEVLLDVFRPDQDPKKDEPALILPLKSKEDPERKIAFKRNDISVEQVKFEIFPRILAGLAAEKPKDKPEDKPKEKPDEKPAGSGPAKPMTGEWKFVPRVARDPAEGGGDPFHTRSPVVVRLEDKKLRVLLLASAPTRDYQFVRTMLVREFDKGRLDLSIYLQPLPSQAAGVPRQRRTGIVQDVPADHLLTRFPDKLVTVEQKKNLSEEEKKKAQGEALYNLAEYDVIVAFDPDWTDESIDSAILERWVTQQGGGMIVVAGPINTLELARVWMKVKDHVQKPDEREKFIKENPLGKYVRILSMYPVVLKDSRLEKDRNTAEPAGLRFTYVEEMDFLKLDEENPKTESPSAWMEFFGRGKGKDNTPGTGHVSRGFYGYYPVAAAKQSAKIVAKFVDDSSEKKTEAPYLVVLPDYQAGRVVWLGSGETWRLRQYKEVWHERLWTKMVRYAGAHSRGTSGTRRIIPELDSRYPAGSKAKLPAKLLTFDLKPLPSTADGKPKDSIARVRIRTENDEVLKGFEDPLPMKAEQVPEQGHDDEATGRYYAEFMPPAAGKYNISIELDNEPPSTKRIEVYEDDPETQDTSPDWAAAYALASDADDVLARIEDRAKAAELEAQLKDVLTRYKAVPAKGDDKPAAGDKEKGDKDKKKDEKLRLVFTLKNAALIPDCMLKHENVQHNRGKLEDVWDDGWVIHTPEDGGKPWKISYVLIGVVGLLAVEWLTRKLLRLA